MPAMNGDASATWSPMVSGTDELENLFDFGDLQLDYNALPVSLQNGEISMPGGMEVQMAGQTTMLPYKDVPEVHASSDSLVELNLRASLYRQQQQHHHHQQQQQHLSQHLPQHQQQQQQHQSHQHQQHQFPSQPLATQYPRHAGVPPTPTSMEMPAMPQQAYAIMNTPSRVMYDAYSGKPHNQVNFTPLVSPAVTPLDTQLRMPEYGAPREYLTPLASPALEALHHTAQLSVSGTYRGSDKSDTASPVDGSGDSLANGGIGHSTPARKPKKRSNPSFGRSAVRPVRSSPAMKPQQKKKAQQKTSSTMPPREIAGLLVAEGLSRHRMTGSGDSGKLSLPTSRHSSETGSISPEPLTEVLMPPPATPRPGSMGRSPFMAAQAPTHPIAYTPVDASPATPASLMRIQKNGSSAALGTPTTHGEIQAPESDIMEVIVLPEPATTSNKRPRPMRVSTLDDQALQARSTRPAPTSVPVSPGATLLPSPSIQSLASPTAAMFPKRPDPKANGKRGNKRTSSIHVSPALRPRISPSIKPLLPEGAHLTSETSALYLASKSNYQNILEGTHLPGVEYPEALSENLTSKRTSHKLAEQGRRNRINTALQEMAALLPPAGTPALNAHDSSPNAVLDKSSTGTASTAAATATTTTNATSSSKASTVELAIEYIKSLRTDRQALEDRLRITESRLHAAELALGRSASPDDATMAEAVI